MCFITASASLHRVHRLLDRIAESARSGQPPGEGDGDGAPCFRHTQRGQARTQGTVRLTFFCLNLAALGAPPGGGTQGVVPGTTQPPPGTVQQHPQPSTALFAPSHGVYHQQQAAFAAPPQPQLGGSNGASPQLLIAENARLRGELSKAEAAVNAASARVQFLEQQQRMTAITPSPRHGGGGSGGGPGMSGAAAATSSAMLDVAELKAEVARVRSALAFRDEEARAAQRELADARERLAAAAAAVASAEAHAAAAAKERDDALAHAVSAAPAAAKDAEPHGRGSGKRGRDGTAVAGPAAQTQANNAVDTVATSPGLALLRITAPLPQQCSVTVLAAASSRGAAGIACILSPALPRYDAEGARVLAACRVLGRCACGLTPWTGTPTLLDEEIAGAVETLCSVLWAPHGNSAASHWRDALVTSLTLRSHAAQRDAEASTPCHASPAWCSAGRIFVVQGGAVDWTRAEQPANSGHLVPASDGAALAVTSSYVGAALAPGGGPCAALCRIAMAAMHQSRVGSRSQASPSGIAVAERISVAAMRCIVALVMHAPALDASREACVRSLLISCFDDMPSAATAAAPGARDSDATQDGTAAARAAMPPPTICLLTRCFSREAPSRVVAPAALCFAALAACAAGRDAIGAQLQQTGTAPLDGILPRALRCLESESVPLAARRACLRGLHNLAHSSWSGWPTAARLTRAPSRLVSAALAALTLAHNSAGGEQMLTFALDCMRLLVYLLLEKDSTYASVRELAGDVPSAQRALSCAAAACDVAVGNAATSRDGNDAAVNLRKLGRLLADKVSAHVTAVEREAAMVKRGAVNGAGTQIF